MRGPEGRVAQREIREVNQRRREELDERRRRELVDAVAFRGRVAQVF